MSMLWQPDAVPAEPTIPFTEQKGKIAEEWRLVIVHSGHRLNRFVTVIMAFWIDGVLSAYVQTFWYVNISIISYDAPVFNRFFS